VQLAAFCRRQKLVADRANWQFLPGIDRMVALTPAAASKALTAARQHPIQLGLGSNFTGPRRPSAHASSQKTHEELWFPIRLSKRRWRRSRSAKRPQGRCENRNEGTPFRCFGLHTHWKAPTEAQTRFSEEILNNSTGLGSTQHSQTQHRQAKTDSRNLLTIATQAADVNDRRQIPAKPSLAGGRGAQLAQDVGVSADGTAVLGPQLAEFMSSFYTEGFPQGIISVHTSAGTLAGGEDTCGGFQRLLS
jgi:hypothetical protein